MDVHPYHWIGFNIFVVVMLILDLTVFHRAHREIKTREALLWTAGWIILALLFNLLIYFSQGKEIALQFLTGYLIEKSLSVDNLFVFLLIFSYFKVPSKYQHKVLFWGIVGAMVMRAIFIFAGVALITRFEWVLYVFAAFLVFTAIRILFQQERKIDPNKNLVIRAFRKIMPVTPIFHEDQFFIRLNEKLYATPLFLVLLLIEASDLIFAVDSIPAIIAVSTDQFIVYTSNVFAILGLRSLYFVIARMQSYFRYLNIALALILVFVGVKMFLHEIYPIPTLTALLVVAIILVIFIIASVFGSPKRENIHS
jgi:tellurite resistance protein TerC